MFVHSPNSTRPNCTSQPNLTDNSDNINTETGTLTELDNRSTPTCPQSNIEICSTTIKLLQFWTNCPEAWFIHAEMQFANRKVTQDITKYEYVVTALPQDVIVTVLDIIQKPPSSNRYDHLKKILIERHSMSENTKLDKILSNSEMGDQKPSEFYRSLALLGNSNFSPDVLRKIWLRKLPNNINVVLTGSNLTDINELTRLADIIWEVLQSNKIASIRDTTPIHSANSYSLEKVVENLVQATTNICNSFNNLSLDVASIKNQLDGQQYRPLNRRLSRSRSRPRSTNRDWICRFHYRYGSEARRCEQPCSYYRQKEDSKN
ncbi:uncharacterized protein LOC124420610 [Lucilia cuprina]|uniref:uncharacterized protein LOC124420610 n=1 Tax=Lucilia cuprina TaxID=7375 RepID=UPI001F057FF5|nr:uncharacterized protein LOC124420610 [Lucilia cuprina]